MPRTNQNEESDEGQSQDDLDEELIPMFTFRKLNNRRGNHSSKGRLGNFNWPWFGKKIQHLKKWIKIKYATKIDKKIHLRQNLGGSL